MAVLGLSFGVIKIGGVLGFVCFRVRCLQFDFRGGIFGKLHRHFRVRHSGFRDLYSRFLCLTGAAICCWGESANWQASSSMSHLHFCNKVPPSRIALFFLDL